MPESKKLKLKKKRLKVKGSKRAQKEEESPKKEEIKKDEKKEEEEKKERKPVRIEEDRSEEEEEESIESIEAIKLHYTALNKILRHGFRFSHPNGERKDWVECMGFLVGDVTDEVVEINDAIPMVHGNLVEVEFQDEHYSKADEINLDLTDRNWIVGWYHTHPGHGLFLSPVDKVNHSGYQSLNPNAVALVFDPSNFSDKNKFKDYIRIFRLENPEMRESSEFVEISDIKIHLPLSEVLNSVYDTTNSVGTKIPTIYEYGEEPEEEEIKPSTSPYLNAEEVERDLRDMRKLIKHLHNEVKVLHGNMQRHMAATNKAVEDLKGKSNVMDSISPVKCEFCGNTSVSVDDTVCSECGKDL
jgi:26S proteasome regulatory subunit N11